VIGEQHTGSAQARQRKRVGRKTIHPHPDAVLVTDPEGARLMSVSLTRFLELQKYPGFPAPVWLGPRGKRHVRAELMAWALTLRARVTE
jgi:hypothetical protein